MVGVLLEELLVLLAGRLELAAVEQSRSLEQLLRRRVDGRRRGFRGKRSAGAARETGAAAGKTAAPARTRGAEPPGRAPRSHGPGAAPAAPSATPLAIASSSDSEDNRGTTQRAAAVVRRPPTRAADAATVNYRRGGVKLNGRRVRPARLTRLRRGCGRVVELPSYACRVRLSGPPPRSS